MRPRWYVRVLGWALLLVIGFGAPIGVRSPDALKFLNGLAPKAEAASWASIGSSVLRWLSRADIVAHKIHAEIDPFSFAARFTDEATVVSRGGASLHILLGDEFALERIVDVETGAELSFGRFLNLGQAPYVIYRVEMPSVASGEERVLRFEWFVNLETVRSRNPFSAFGFFYVGHASLWHPYTPHEGFFDADLTVTAPVGFTIFADGVTVDEWEQGERVTKRFVTEAPVNGIGFGIGHFEVTPLETDHAAPLKSDGKRPVSPLLYTPSGTIRPPTAPHLKSYVAATHRFISERLGPLPTEHLHLVEVPFYFPAAFPSIYGLVYGGDLRSVGANSDGTLAMLIAHETAHQWIGSLVGVRVLGSAWLTEGLSEYLGFLALTETFSDDERLGMWKERIYEPFVQLAGTKESRALGSLELVDPQWQQVYQKGALLFRELHYRLGDAAFFDLVAQFVATHRGRVVGGGDFIAWTREYLKESGAADPLQLSAADVPAFFNRWLRGDPQYDLLLHVGESPFEPNRLRLHAASVGKTAWSGDVEVSFHFENGERHVASIPVGQEVEFELPSRPWMITLDPHHWIADIDPSNNWWIAPD